MKSNKKMVALHVLASLIIAQTAMAARIEGTRSPVGGGVAGSTPTSTTSKSSEATKIESDQVSSVNIEDCTQDQDAATFFPQSLFPSLTRDLSGLSVELKPNNKVVVKIPPILNICGAFVPELRQNKETKDVTVLMKLLGTRKVDGKEVKNVQLTHKELEDCLKEKTVKVGDKDVPVLDGKIDHANIPGKYYTESSYSMDFDFDKKTDIKKTVALSFGFPSEYKDPTTGYPPAFEFDNKAQVGMKCMLAEKLGKKAVYVNKGPDILIEEINEVCKKGTAQDIADLRKLLGNEPSISDLLPKIIAEMDTGYLAKVKDDVNEIYKQMDSIEKDIVADFRKPEKERMSEEEAKEKIKEYSKLTVDLDTQFLTPAVKRLDDLMATRTKLKKDSPEVKGIDAEIKKINLDIGAFGKRDTRQKDKVYDLMSKFAMIEDASTIDDINLKSLIYSKVYVGRRDTDRASPVTFEGARKEHLARHNKFKKAMDEDWTDIYLARNGDEEVMKRAQGDITKAQNRLRKHAAAFDQKEAKDYQAYCTAGMLGMQKNTVKCKEFQAGAQKRYNAAFKSLQRDFGNISKKNMKYAKMAGHYEKYLADEAERGLSSEDPNGYFDEDEDEFDSRFTYDYATRSGMVGAYDPGLYNMQGNPQQAPMQMMPQQFMPQQQQYMQMPQGGMQGGWTGI